MTMSAMRAPLIGVAKSAMSRTGNRPVALTGAASSVRFNSSNSSSSDAKTHFGFRDVASSDKAGLVGSVFSSVASSYDLMNDAMSLGIHRLWKSHFVSQLDPRGGIACLDVAGGTGDIATRILDHARTAHGDRQTKVTVLDINEKMLRAGQKNMAQTMYWGTDQLAFQLGNAEDLSLSAPPTQSPASTSQQQRLPRNSPTLPALPTQPIPSDSLDLYTIAFGIRDCTDIDAVLREAHRVLRPGGVFACLEFGKVDGRQLPFLPALYRRYSFDVIPSLGQVLAGDRDSYQYLVESIERFPTQPEFARMMQRAGFTLAGQPEAAKWGLGSLGGETGKRDDDDVKGAWQDLTLGIASIWHGIKL